MNLAREFKMFEIKYNNKSIGAFEYVPTKDYIKNFVISEVNIEDFYLVQNGKVLSSNADFTNGIVHVVGRLLGGKGGFGSMLRAIGAQIEKTTNREACRDLSGRRLRDINEEKRLKAWIDKQVNREQEAEDKKLKKLERMVQQPKHEFKDEVYDKERSELPDRLEDAVTQGLMDAASASTSTSGSKRKPDEAQQQQQQQVKKKKKCLWVEEGLELSSSDETEDSDQDETADEELKHKNEARALSI